MSRLGRLSLLGLADRVGTLLVVGLDVDLKVHLVGAEFPDAQLGPDGLVVGHPLAQVVDNALVLAGNVGAVGDDAVDLAPSLAAGMLEVVVAVLEGLVDLVEQSGVDQGFEIELGGLSVPATCWIVSLGGKC